MKLKGKTKNDNHYEAVINKVDIKHYYRSEEYEITASKWLRSPKQSTNITSYGRLKRPSPDDRNISRRSEKHGLLSTKWNYSNKVTWFMLYLSSTITYHWKPEQSWQSVEWRDYQLTMIGFSSGIDVGLVHLLWMITDKNVLLVVSLEVIRKQSEFVDNVTGYVTKDGEESIFKPCWACVVSRSIRIWCIANVLLRKCQRMIYIATYQYLLFGNIEIPQVLEYV